jgi:transcriptional regulator with XRE-family HTH domain
MSNIITGRQLRAARILAGLTQKQLAQAVGVHERAARYWELKEGKAPTSTPSSLEKIEAVCAACHRRCRSEGNSRPELTGRHMRMSFAFKRQCQICQAISIIRRR